MGCVVTLAIVADGRLTIGHVGDTRLYKVRPESIRKITRDHSPVGELEDSGELAEPEAMRHPRRHEVFRDIGTVYRDKDEQEFVDIIEEPLEPDASILLCSDGLSDMLPAGTIAHIVRQHAGWPERVVEALVAAANDAGGRDNITVVYAEMPRLRRAPRPHAGGGTGSDGSAGRRGRARCAPSGAGVSESGRHSRASATEPGFRRGCRGGRPRPCAPRRSDRQLEPRCVVRPRRPARCGRRAGAHRLCRDHSGARAADTCRLARRQRAVHHHRGRRRGQSSGRRHPHRARHLPGEREPSQRRRPRGPSAGHRHDRPAGRVSRAGALAGRAVQREGVRPEDRLRHTGRHGRPRRRVRGDPGARRDRGRGTPRHRRLAGVDARLYGAAVLPSTGWY